jgi:hypothetical protein
VKLKTHPIRVGYKVEARYVNPEAGDEGHRYGHGELAGRGFSGSIKLAQERAKEKLSQRPNSPVSPALTSS